MPAVAIPVFQAPGSNALALSDAVRKNMAELSKNFPEGIKYDIVYDPTHLSDKSNDNSTLKLFRTGSFTYPVALRAARCRSCRPAVWGGE